MSVIINFKICDNAEECNGIAVCPTGALAWDKKKKKIIINNKKCISCGKCKKVCEVGAISVAKTKEEYRKLKKEVDNDPRKVTDLFTERYGAQPLYTPFFIIEKDFDVHVLKAKKLTALELFSNESIKCLLYSLPIRDIFEGLDIGYRKMKVETGNKLLKEYKVKKLPSLLFFKSGKLIGKIEGYHGNEEKEMLIKKIAKIVKPSPLKKERTRKFKK
jgi:NAD-dependent dihydropyrimidine dehydrogenase PreA subunit